jgi:hypothetical protein
LFILSLRGSKYLWNAPRHVSISPTLAFHFSYHYLEWDRKGRNSYHVRSTSCRRHEASPGARPPLRPLRKVMARSKGCAPRKVLFWRTLALN